jgi:hypothetical protein
MSTTPYHKRFKRHRKKVVAATRRLQRRRPWSRDDWDQLAREWVYRVSREYGMRPPGVEYAPWATEHGGGAYVPYDNTIYLSHFSMTTLLHEYRHAMQCITSMPLIDDRNSMEEDARAWSLSLFARACPSRFKRMVEAGRIHHLEAKEL